MYTYREFSQRIIHKRAGNNSNARGLFSAVTMACDNKLFSIVDKSPLSCKSFTVFFIPEKHKYYLLVDLEIVKQNIEEYYTTQFGWPKVECVITKVFETEGIYKIESVFVTFSREGA